MTEVGTVVGFVEQALGALENGIDLIVVFAAGHWQQNMANINVRRGHKAALFRVEEVIQLLAADTNTTHYLALLHAHQNHFIANFFAHVGQGRASGVDLLGVLLHGYLIAAGDSCHGIVQFSISDTNTGAVAHIQLQAFGDQAF